MRHVILNTFTGPFAILEMDDGSLRTMWLNAESEPLLRPSALDRNLQPKLMRALARYFDGEDVDFSFVQLPRTPAFQVACWRACRRIPRGKTRTYAQLAAAAGSPDACRAAGQAMRRNPLPVIVPCHRVVGSNGRLHGFGGSLAQDGCELSIKRQLLQMEAVFADESDLSGCAPTKHRTSSAAVA